MIESFWTEFAHLAHKYCIVVLTRRDYIPYLYGSWKIVEIALNTLNKALPVNVYNVYMRHYSIVLII